MNEETRDIARLKNIVQCLKEFAVERDELISKLFEYHFNKQAVIAEYAGISESRVKAICKIQREKK